MTAFVMFFGIFQPAAITGVFLLPVTLECCRGLLLAVGEMRRRARGASLS